MRSEKAGGTDRTAVLTPELLGRYWPEAGERLVTALCAYGIDTATAEDAVAEAVTRALGRQLAVDNLEHFCRWVFVVARNIAVDSTRRTRLMVLVDELPDAPADYNLTEHAEARARWQETADAMRRLSAMDRAALLHELDPRERVGRRESVKQAVRRHRARARLRHALGQLGGWLGWLRRPTWPWPSLPSASLEGLAALALLPLLAGSVVSVAGPGGSNIALPTPPAVAGGTTAARPPVPVVKPPVPATALSAAAAPQDSAGPVEESLARGWRFEFTPSPSYDEDHTVFATGGETCEGSVAACSLVYMSRDGGASWRLLPSRGRSRDNGRILLPPSYPKDSRIFWTTPSELSVSTDGGETFRPVTPATGPAVMTPLFSTGDPRIFFGSNRHMRSPLPMQYRDGDIGLSPFQLPLPPAAAAMELWFAGSYADDGRMFVSVLEAPGLPDPAKPRVAHTVPAMYTCGTSSCSRVVDLGMDLLPPMVTWSPAAPDIVFVGSTNTLHRSIDGGGSFQRIALPPTDGGLFLSSLMTAPDGRLYVKVRTGSAQQLFASDDAGETWTLLRNEPVAFANLAVLPDGTLIEGRPSASGDGVRCSGDRGRTWSPCAA